MSESKHTPEEKIALFVCRPQRSGRLILQIQHILSHGATKIIVEESNIKKHHDKLLEACKKLLMCIGIAAIDNEPIGPQEPEIVAAQAAIADAEKGKVL